jgi:hypothetical protein
MVLSKLKASVIAFAIHIALITPHRTQAEFLECRARIKVLVCGRRWGKSTAAAIELLWFAVAHPGTSQCIVAPTMAQAAITFDIAHKLAEEGLLKPLIVSVVHTPFPELTLRTGDPAAPSESTITARPAGYDGRNIRGHGFDRVVVDEAAYVPERVITDVIEPMLATSEFGELVLMSTPFGLNHFYDYFQQGQLGDPDIRSFQYPSRANPGVSKLHLARQKLTMPDQRYRVEYGAEFLEDQCTVFRRDYITAAIDESIQIGRVEHGHRYVIGFDPAKNHDRSAVVVMDVTDEPWRVVEVRNVNERDYQDQVQIVACLASYYHDAQVLLDTTSHVQMREELHSRGVSVEGYVFTNASKQELVDQLTLAFESRKLKIPPCDDLISELGYYRFEYTDSGHLRSTRRTTATTSATSLVVTRWTSALHLPNESTADSTARST